LHYAFTLTRSRAEVRDRLTARPRPFGRGGCECATVEIHQAVSGYDRTTNTDSKGNFSFTNVPFNPYHMTVTATGFAQYAQDVETRSVVPVNVKIILHVSGSSITVTVESAGDLIENDPTFHADIDKELFDKLPLESASSSLSSLVTLSTPGIAADSNGLFHGIGDHAENSFSIDGQPLPTSKARSSRTSFPSNPFSLWKSYPARHPRNTEARPAW
jgi:hypothetical protein